MITQSLLWHIFHTNIDIALQNSYSYRKLHLSSRLSLIQIQEKDFETFLSCVFIQLINSAYKEKGKHIRNGEGGDNIA